MAHQDDGHTIDRDDHNCESIWHFERIASHVQRNLWNAMAQLTSRGVTAVSGQVLATHSAMLRQRGEDPVPPTGSACCCRITFSPSLCVHPIKVLAATQRDGPMNTCNFCWVIRRRCHCSPGGLTFLLAHATHDTLDDLSVQPDTHAEERSKKQGTTHRMINHQALGQHCPHCRGSCTFSATRFTLSSEFTFGDNQFMFMDLADRDLTAYLTHSHSVCFSPCSCL